MNTKIQHHLAPSTGSSGSGTRVAFLLAVLLGAAAGSQAQSVVYRENFTFNNPAADTIAEMGWSVSVGLADGTLRPGDLSKTYVNNSAGISVAAAPSVASFPAVPDNNTGSLGVSLDWTGAVSLRRAFFSTTEVAPLSIQSSNITSITYGGSDSGFQTGGWGADLFRGQVALQIGGTWYVSNTVNTATSVGFTIFTVDPSAVTWSTINPSQSLATVAGTAMLPQGTIEAAGLLITANSDAYLRFDQFTITAIPEPSAFTVLAALGALGFTGMRRRRQAPARA